METLFTKCLLTGLVLLSTFLQSIGQTSEIRDFYVLKIYELKDKKQEAQLDNFLEKAYLPAMHKLGVETVGVFKSKSDSEGVQEDKVYVFIPFSSPEAYFDVNKKLSNDKEYQTAGKSYIDASHDQAPYERIETIFMHAFEGMSRFQKTKLTNAKEERIYELRSYESATEKLFHNKVAMFNNGEIEIFERLGFNPVFFGEVIAGSNMPNLMYLTTHESKAAQTRNWEAFGKDEAWIEMKDKEEYKNNVSHIDIILLYPTDYSDL